MFDLLSPGHGWGPLHRKTRLFFQCVVVCVSVGPGVHSWQPVHLRICPFSAVCVTPSLFTCSPLPTHLGFPAWQGRTPRELVFSMWDSSLCILPHE